MSLIKIASLVTRLAQRPVGEIVGETVITAPVLIYIFGRGPVVSKQQRDTNPRPSALAVPQAGTINRLSYFLLLSLFSQADANIERIFHIYAFMTKALIY